VRRLPGVETLGSTTVICTDKTGTLTEGRLEVAALVVGDRVTETRDPDVRALLAAAVRASEPTPYDPLDKAILAAATAAGLDVDALHAARLLRDHPFDPARKLVSHVWEDGGDVRTAVKGSFEGVLALADGAPPGVHEAHRALADRGVRVIAVAEGPATREGDRAADEAGARWLGLVGFADPPRPGVREALADCAGAGIRVVMITGDHPLTAHAIANELGLPHDDRTGVVTGDDLDAADDAALDALIGHAAIFARTRPEQKHRLVRALRRQGQVVAMTGDGVNDAPALREADVGVAMGRRGTEVARQAATLVLLDDDFTTLVAAVAEGRRIFRSLRQAFAYLVGFHVPLILGALVVPLVGAPLLLLPVHLVLLELVVHPTVALVFEREPAPPDLMRRPPRPRDQGLLDRRALRTVVVGLLLTLVVLGQYLLELPDGDAHARARAFATLVLGQVALVLVERTPEVPIWRAGLRGNPVLLPVLAGTVLGLVLALSIPASAHWLHGEPLGPTSWALCAALAVAPSLLAEPFKRRA
jgi:Ca2+-transporting ATPase